MLFFRNYKKLRSHLIRAVLLDLDDVNRSKLCRRKRPLCDLCSITKDADSFKSKNFEEVYHITKLFDCNSNMVVSFVECRVCREQYTGSTVTKFRMIAKNYERTHRTFCGGKRPPNQAQIQKRFHEHYLSDGHNGINN